MTGRDHLIVLCVFTCYLRAGLCDMGYTIMGQRGKKNHLSNGTAASTNVVQKTFILVLSLEKIKPPD